MSRVLVLGNATLDLIQRVERLPAPGETVLAQSTARCAGGKGLNQAVASSRTGAPTRLIAPIGQDSDAAFIADSLRGETGLAVNWLACNATTDLSAIWVASGGENVIVSSTDCARSVTSDQARSHCNTMTAGDVLLMQGNLSADVTRAAAQTALARGATRVLNTAPIAWDMRAILGLFDIVIANEGEAVQLTAGSPSAAASLHASGVRTAIITLGARGALILEDGHETMVEAPPVTAIDTAGAGDVFVGTLAGLLANGVSLPKAVTIAVAAASLSVTRPNTTPSFPSRAEIAVMVEGVGCPLTTAAAGRDT
jgi:ribokinase